MEDHVKTSISHMHSKIKFWSWTIFIFAVAILLAMIIFHFAYWLMVIGAATVIALAITLGFYISHLVHKVKETL